MRKAIFVAIATLVACFPGLEHLEDGVAADAATPDVEASVIEDAGDEPDAPVIDTSKCDKPLTVAPAPDFASVLTCSLDQMIDVDGKVGGLDRSDTSTSIEHTYDGHAVVSCAAFDFGKVLDPTRTIDVYAVGSTASCGHGCNASLPPDQGCGSANFYWLYWGPSPDIATAKFVDKGDVPVPFHPIGRVSHTNVPTVDRRYIFICRSSAGTDRDDVDVDGVLACPR